MSAPASVRIGGVTRWTLVAVVGVAALYATQLDTRWHVGRDSALYLGVGRNIAAGEGMTFNGRSMTHLSPGLPLLWAGLIETVGQRYLAMRLIMYAAALATIAAGYVLARRLRPEVLAAAAAILLVGNARLLGYVSVVQTDLPFAMLVTVSLLFAHKYLGGCWGSLVIASLAVSAAVLFRLVGVVIAPLLALGMVLDRSTDARLRRRVLGAVVLLATVVVTWAAWWAWYRAHQDPAVTGYFGTAAAQASSGLAAVVSRIGGNLRIFARHLLGLYIDQRPNWLLAWLMALVPAAGLVLSIRRREWGVAIPAMGYLGFLVFYARSAMDARYFLPVLVPLSIWLADGVNLLVWLALRRDPRRLRRRRTALWVLCGLLAVLAAVPTLAKTFRYPGETWRIDDEDQLALDDLAGWIRDHTDPDAVLIAREQAILHVHTDRRILYPREAPDETAAIDREGLERMTRRAEWLILDPDDEEPRERLLADWLAEHPARAAERLRKFGYRIVRLSAATTAPAPAKRDP